MSTEKATALQLFYARVQPLGKRPVRARQYARVVDWATLRSELRRLRDEHDFTREELQQQTGIEKTTIYRIENTKELPDYKPDLDTIEAIVSGIGLTLSEFFARIEGLNPPAVGATDLASSTKAADHGGDLPAASAAQLHVQNAYIESVLARLAAAVERLAEPRSHARRHQREKPVDRRRAKGSRS